jgi:hypothetical protein
VTAILQKRIVPAREAILCGRRAFVHAAFADKHSLARAVTEPGSPITRCQLDAKTASSFTT